MKSLFVILLAILVTPLTNAHAAEQTTINIVADEWCPFNCDPESDKPGYVIELAKEIFKPYG
ncbi:MAG: hypothetical protein ABL857_08835, partial [Rickettsiales bacterium]